MYNYDKGELKDFLKRQNKLEFNISDYLNNSIKKHENRLLSKKYSTNDIDSKL
jgi:hypothetical protein